MAGKFQQFSEKFATMQAPTLTPVLKSQDAEGLSLMERQQLASLSGHPGFAVLEKLLEFEADRFTSQLVGLKTSNKDDIADAHTRAQVAWEIVSHLLRQINYEIGEANADAEAVDEVIDPTTDPLGDIL
jgi:hypothetical protein